MISTRSCWVCRCLMFVLVFGLVLFVGQQSALVMAQTDPGQGDPGAGAPPPPPPGDQQPPPGDPPPEAPPEPDFGRTVAISSGVVAVVPEGSSTESIEETVTSALARTSGESTFVVFPSSDLSVSSAKTFDDRGFIRDYVKPLARYSPAKAARLLTDLAGSSPSSFNRLLSQAGRSYGFSCKLFKERLSKLAKHGESCKMCRLKECKEGKESGEEEAKIEDTDLYKCLVELLQEVA